MIKRVLAFTNPAYLSLRLKQIVIKVYGNNTDGLQPQKDKPTIERTAPIEDIGVVILDHKQITITQALIAALLENNVALITCDEQHMPTGLMLPLEGNHLQHERFMNQIKASEPLRKNLWQQTVQQKIRNQAEVLASVGCENKNMLKWAVDVRSGDNTNLEGRAAVYYWKNVFRQYPNFVRGQDGAYPNNLLNYGYAIVRALMARSLMAAGLLPTFGIHHHNRYNSFCLADDIMEPYRPYVDKYIVDIIDNITTTELNHNLKQHLLSLPVSEVLMEGKRRPMMLAIQATANSLQRCFSGESRKILYPEM